MAVKDDRARLDTHCGTTNDTTRYTSNTKEINGNFVKPTEDE